MVYLSLFYIIYSHFMFFSFILGFPLIIFTLLIYFKIKFKFPYMQSALKVNFFFNNSKFPKMKATIASSPDRNVDLFDRRRPSDMLSFTMRDFSRYI